MELLGERRMRELVYGGAVLGAGGGGSIDAGLVAGREALAEGTPRLAHIGELPPKTLVATLSIVGSVDGMTGEQAPPEHGLALRRLAEVEKRSIGAFIPSEVGPQAVLYGWRESALAGVPIADAPCNGRAHPLGLMGSLGLHRRPSYVTSTVGIGGSHTAHTRVELILRTSATKASQMVRHNAATSGIPLAVARNPLPASYVRRNAAVGGLKYAADVGKIVLNEINRGLPRLLECLSQWLGGQILSDGRVNSAALAEAKGFTVGHILINDQDGSDCRVAVCNEYLAFQRRGIVLAAFPDLITLFDFDSALPLASPEVKPGKRVAVFAVPRARLKLGSTMKDPALLRPVERLLNIRLAGNGMPTRPLSVEQTHRNGRRV
jgi:uncharacterized protein